ncbi:O-antigen ligase family protein [Streptococcus suis]|uniref:O-antigen ligase family protein n=1 Tax=Streptococcus suis TaxID=1307 RepID=UPI001C96BA10|nr:O-antigen ligase family protein [Streptococcus suis]MBY5014094.1 O-antigen ligase family protein [Streptococcus suis]
MLELLLSLILQNTYQFNILGSIRLVDVLLLLIFSYCLIFCRGKLALIRDISLLIVIRIVYILLTLGFFGNLTLGTAMSLGYFFEFILVWFIIINFQSRISFEKIWNIGVILLVINNIYAIIELFFYSENRAGGFIGPAITCFALPYIIYGLFNRSREFDERKSQLISLIGIAGAIASKQRTLIILILLNIFIYLLLSRRNLLKLLPKIIFSFIIIALIILFVIPDSLKEYYIYKYNEIFWSLTSSVDSPMHIRYVLWDASIGLFFSSPLIGIGSGMFTRQSATQLQNFSTRLVTERVVGLSTHNFFLEYASELGIIGLFLTYFLIFLIFGDIKKRAIAYGLKNDFMFDILYSSLLTLTLYDLFGQGTFLYFWNYTLIIMYSYLFYNKKKNHDFTEKLI